MQAPSQSSHQATSNDDEIRSWIKLARPSQSIRKFTAIIMMHFSTIYLNLIGSYRRKVLVTKKDPCDVICDVTQSKKEENNLRRHNVSVGQTYLMREFALYHLCFKMSKSSIPHRLIMGRSSDWSDLRWRAQKNRDIKQYVYPGACYFLKGLFSWERLAVIGSVAKLQQFMAVRSYTYL